MLYPRIRVPFRYSEHGYEIEIPIDPDELAAAMAEQGLDLPGVEGLERPRGPWQSLQAELIHNGRVKIGHFELIETIGSGAMGAVFRALDPRMDRTVALKLWSEKLPTTESGGPDPLDEIRALAKLTHPNVVSIYDIGEYEGRPYLVLEDVQGIDAGQWAPGSWQDVLFVYIRVGRGLAAAHAAGILHNDVKPSNVLLGHDQRVKVSDFGLAASMTTGRDKLCGTVLYMAPDTIRGPASDQFSLCVSIYESLYGSLPFIAKSFVGIVEAIDNGEFQVGSSPLPGIPDRLRAAVLRGLSLDPADRHASVADLVTELEQCLADGAEPPAGADGGESAEGGEAASQQTENERPQAPTSEHRASRQSEPKPRGLRNLGPAVIALLLLAGPMLGSVATLGIQRAGTLQIEDTVQGLTRKALLAAEQGDGDTALSLLEDARDLARTVEEKCFVAKKADDVGMRLYDARRWQDAINAYDFAMTIYAEHGKELALVRSAHLIDAALQAKKGRPR